jgi:hypothetical protein
VEARTAQSIRPVCIRRPQPFQARATVTVTATSSLAAVPGSTYVTVDPATALGASQITVTATEVGGAAHGDVVTLTVR